MTIAQGDVYWLDLADPVGSEPGYRHPHVVIQNDVFNQSRIRTIIVCTLTSNLRLADLPGNVRLGPGEGGLSRPSVVNVTQILTVDRADLHEKIGSLSARRIRQILNGIHRVLEPVEVEDPKT